jgi:hypothetical protein
VAEASVHDMLVPPMSAISMTLEPGEYLSFRAYASALVDGKHPGFQVQADGSYTTETLPGTVDQCDGFVWTSEVR